MKKTGLIATVSVVALTVTACGGTSTDSPSASAGAGNEQVELRIMWWGDQKRADKTNEALRKFEEKYPHIKVVGEFAPSSGYFDKLNTQIASGTAPDVFFLGGNVVDYVSKGVLLDLNPYVGKELNLDDMDKSMIAYGTFKEKLYHVSAGANARAIVVNTDLFKKAGMEIPQDDWTWDDYARIAKEISDKLGKDVFGTYDYTVDGMGIYMGQIGKTVYDMDKNVIGFEQKDAENWFAYWDNMRKAGGVVTPELQVSNPPGDTSKSLIVTGRVAMGLIPSNQLVAHQNLTKDHLTLVQVPRGANGSGVAFESSQGLSGYAKTKHPKEVAQLINFWINDPDAAKILGNDRGVPVTAAMRDLLKKDASPVEQIIYDYLNRVSEANKKQVVKISYNPPGFTEYSKLLETTVQEISFGRKDVKKGAEDFYTGAVKIFNNNK
ncbi:ABC transporter substrate-binding protein [Paenibacillus thermoaerophilus]|uniref:ABC transporter substrate-binding protein n=1 Tax=Paenibacillus thermoaerophilus TaxID=1215385 RepID=A0ABW2V5Z4_9BACL|nr:extracellular solute-binding protein [Paenibacillus thermoaerophilus]TMV06660.1 extracellular solute-binding protein [Paenibacillus thermoaerophilus]